LLCPRQFELPLNEIAPAIRAFSFAMKSSFSISSLVREKRKAEANERFGGMAAIEDGEMKTKRAHCVARFLPLQPSCNWP
jgi:hypothetical protein